MRQASRTSSEKKESRVTYKLSLEEQETVVNICKADDYAEIYTTNPQDIKRFLKFADDEGVSILQHDDISLRMRVPKKYICVRRPIVRNLTDEQKAELAERMRKAREK